MIKNKKQSGFTLIELLVAATVFIILLTILGGIFARILKLSKQDFAAQKVQENVLFILESVAKEIRISQIVTPPNLPGCSTSLNITHPTKGAIIYSLSGAPLAGLIQKQVSAQTVTLNSSEVNFSRLLFCVIGSQADKTQARVIIVMTANSLSDPTVGPYNLETTVTARVINE